MPAAKVALMTFFCKQPQPSRSVSLQPLRRPDLAAVCGLLIAVAVIYWQVSSHQFVAWDDTSYVSENSRVLQGLSWQNVQWAFFTFQLSNWHPLTLLSHMLDVSLWGPKAGAHALGNVLLHAINSVLVFLFFQRVTGERWPSVWVGLLFAVHPLHVESVAWISERKDVLCAFFWLLAMHAYLGYWRQRSWAGYLRVSLSIALALLAKPMAVTVPICLLLIERWLSGPAVVWRARLLEAFPWLLMAGAVGVLTIKAQSGAMPDFEPLQRILVAISAYGWYLEKTLLPTGLHFYYLTEEAQSVIRLSGSAAALLVLSWAAYTQRHERPIVVVGWCWFLLTLLPVVGFVKVGTQAWADRYAYLPHVGLFAAAVFWACGIKWRMDRRLLAFVLASVVLVAAAVSFRQVGYWRDTENLYRRAYEINDRHYVALMGLANHALRQGELQRAEQMGRQALSLSAGPSLVRSMRLLLGDIALQRGKGEEALREYQAAISAEPMNAQSYTKLGAALLKMGQAPAASGQFSQALKLMPDDPAAHNGLGVSFALQGKFADAIEAFQRGLLLAPKDISLRLNFAMTMRKAGDTAGAVALYREILRDDPDNREALAALHNMGG